MIKNLLRKMSSASDRKNNNLAADRVVRILMHLVFIIDTNKIIFFTRLKPKKIPKGVVNLSILTA